jgi:hypothetical protein
LESGRWKRTKRDCHGLVISARCGSVAKASIFDDFLKALREAWKTALPVACPADASMCTGTPKSSIFYVGMAPPSGLHVFVRFNASEKPWQVGQFQIGFLLSKQLEYPWKWAFPKPPEDPSLFTEGFYYLIHEYNGKHWLGKVWHLLDDQASVAEALWFASSYADPAVVFSEAISDVTQEVTKALHRLGIATATDVA